MLAKHPIVVSTYGAGAANRRPPRPCREIAPQFQEIQACRHLGKGRVADGAMGVEGTTTRSRSTTTKTTKILRSNAALAERGLFQEIQATRLLGRGGGGERLVVALAQRTMGGGTEERREPEDLAARDLNLEAWLREDNSSNTDVQVLRSGKRRKHKSEAISIN